MTQKIVHYLIYPAIIAVLIGTIGILFSLSATILKFADTGWHGYGVDSNDKLYVGRLNQILVFDGGTLEDTIQLPEFKIWSLGVQEDDTLVVSSGSNIYVMDLNGNVLTKEADQQDRYSDLLHQNCVVDSSGAAYTKHAPLGWTQIIDAEDNVCYRVPIVDYLAKIMAFISVGCYLIGIPIVTKYEKMRDET